jgi:DNA repair photolyase
VYADAALSERPRRGRGAPINPAGRFERLEIEPLEPAPARVATEFLRDASRTIIARNESPDVGFDASVNPYRGCEHGCAYCYARPTHEYLGFSAGLDFETRIMVKEEAAQLLERELAAPAWRPQVLGVSGVTDPYQPVERRLRLTRRCLEVLARCRNPVALVTKNALVVRDLDLLAELAGHGAAVVWLSLTTLDVELARRLEPRCSAPAARLEAMRRLAEAGVPVGALLAPVIPALNDHEIPALLTAAAAAGASHCRYIVLRLPGAVAEIFPAWLEAHYPERREKVLSRIRDLRRGRLNDSRFGTRGRGEGVFARQIRDLFYAAARRCGLETAGPELSTAAFRRPAGDQLDLFADES